MNISELTEEQAKNELAFYMELTENQSNEIGRLNTEGIKANMTIRNLKKALQGMVDVTKADKENPEGKKKYGQINTKKDKVQKVTN